MAYLGSSKSPNRYFDLCDFLVNGVLFPFDTISLVNLLFLLNNPPYSYTKLSHVGIRNSLYERIDIELYGPQS